MGQLEIKDKAMLYRILIALNRRLHDRDDNVRRAALSSIRKLVEGRPLPGYQWVPLRERKAREHKIMRLINFTLIIVALIVSFLYWQILLTFISDKNIVIQFIAWILPVATFVAASVQILGEDRRRKVIRWLLGE